MAQYAENLQSFNRYELKFWTTPKIQRELLGYFSEFMHQDKHTGDRNSYDVTSLYFDRYGLPSYHEKFNGDLVRRKYRIRFYNNDPSKLFFEIKKKYNHFVKKSRVAFVRPFDDFKDLPRFLNDNVGNKHEFFHSYLSSKLEPSCWVRYRRSALYGKNNKDLRITFDEDLSGNTANGFTYNNHRLQDVGLSRSSRKVIMEIKFSSFFPLWLENAMKHYGIIQESISKYAIVLDRFGTLREGTRWTR